MSGIVLNRSVSFSFFVILLNSTLNFIDSSSYTAMAQIPVIEQDCETTQIYQDGYGWIAGSAITTCETNITYINDGSQMLGNLGSSCGSGPCEGPPPDSEEVIDEKSCEFEQGIEKQKDIEANEYSDLIQQKTDWDEVEYGALIYRNTMTGGIRFGTLQRGDEDGVPLDPARRTNEVFAGIIHSHPEDSIGAPSDIDWASARNLVDSDRANAADFSHYILDYDTKELNEFDYTGDRFKTKPTRETKRDAKGECK